jgi:hypothetical protein
MQDAFAVDSDNKPLTYKATRHSPDKALWVTEEANELIRLLETTGTIEWMDWRDKPSERLASYYNPQVKVKLKLGTVVRRVRGTIGGNVTDYTGPRSAWTADMQTVKLLLNATVSEPGARFMTADISDYYLGTELTVPEYMWIDKSLIPATVQQRYSKSIIWSTCGRKSMVRVKRGIFGLPYAGRIAHAKLSNLLERHGYTACVNTPCLFRHVTRPISFTLVVDDFGIKYTNRQDVDHLLNAIHEEYKTTEDWDGSKYLGMTIEHDIDARAITVSMPGYAAAAVKRFGIVPIGRTDSPAPYTPPIYGKSPQHTPVDESPARLIEPNGVVKS